MIEFQAWPKTPRLFRDILITEKIDGTNAAVHVVALSPFDTSLDLLGVPGGDVVTFDGVSYLVAAQSRKRMIQPGKTTDNYGFAGWVRENAEALARTLGEGIHYGEWWGSSIQTGYGLTDGDRRFSLFNADRWAEVRGHQDAPPALGVVPVLYRGSFDTANINLALDRLREGGSVVAPGFMKPEGIIVWHFAARQVFKVLIENDGQPKGQV